MPDESYLDERYFVDADVYNCPFCNRRHVMYSIYAYAAFDWTQGKQCYVYFVRCHSCNGDSMHLTYQKLRTYDLGIIRNSQRWRFSFPEDVDAGHALEEAFFYSVPTSFFVLDERVPRVLRELLTEAEGSLKSNFLTGASACMRPKDRVRARIVRDGFRRQLRGSHQVAQGNPSRSRGRLLRHSAHDPAGY